MPSVTLGIATLAVLLSLAVALATARAWREAAAEAAALQKRAGELASRLEAVERTAGQAAARAEAASHLLLEKGIADEDELEAIRQLVEAPEGDAPDVPRGGQTVH